MHPPTKWERDSDKVRASSCRCFRSSKKDRTATRPHPNPLVRQQWWPSRGRARCSSYGASSSRTRAPSPYGPETGSPRECRWSRGAEHFKRVDGLLIGLEVTAHGHEPFGEDVVKSDKYLFTPATFLLVGLTGPCGGPDQRFRNVSPLCHGAPIS